MNEPNNGTSSDSSNIGALQAARLDNLRKIEGLGHDPWGARFDDRELIGTVRNRFQEVKYKLADGTLVATPELPSPERVPSLLATSDVFGTGWFAADAAQVTPGMTVAVVGAVVLARRSGQKDEPIDDVDDLAPEEVGA